MPQVLNSRERNQAFLKFLAFFLLTVTLIVCAVYVDFRGLPESRRKYLEHMFNIQRAEMRGQQQFVAQMEKVKVLLDSLGKSPENQVQIDMLLRSKLTDLDQLQQKDSSVNGKLNAYIMLAFMELHALKKDQLQLYQTALKVSDLERRLNECQVALDTWRARPQVAVPQQ